ncbi:MAG: nucleoside monophosphate kinase [Candidatus Pacebacteria bacterium]|nr:nucleoside monophosphate kinase [Candidatus Paceibacterota bacterium]
MESHPVNTLFLIGRPGSGKGTQTELLAKKLGWKTLSSGNTFRELRTNEGSLGEKVRETYDSGKLFPHWFPIYLFQNEVLNLAQTDGLLCEGFVRAVDEAKAEDEVLAWLGRRYVVINLAVSEEEAMRRQLSRHEVDARPDSDSEEKIRVRFEEYTKRTAHVLDFFREKGVLIEVNGEETPEHIADELYEKLKTLI